MIMKWMVAKLPLIDPLLELTVGGILIELGTLEVKHIPVEVWDSLLPK